MSDSILDDIEMNDLGKAKIKVFGVGGGGGNAVQKMIDANLVGVEFVAANTDTQALLKNNAPIKVQLGKKLTGGLGSGAKPDVGREAAIESLEEIREAIGDANMVFVTAGMGKGTGTGAAPIVAQAAKERGALTVGVVTKPFGYEGRQRMATALRGLDELKKYVDSLIIIENDRLHAIAPKGTPLLSMFMLANQVLLNAVRGISDVIMNSGEMNVDFADVRTIMSETGLALMGSGRAAGDNRAHDAASQAISCPLLQDVSLESAKAILYNITAGPDMSGEEMSEISSMIHDAAGEDVNIIAGFVVDESMKDEIQVTVIATGIEEVASVDAGERAVTSKVKQFPQNSQQRQQVQVASEDEDFPEEEQKPVRARAGNWNEVVHRGMYPSKQRTRHTPGEDAPVYDPNDLDIPAFLRGQIN